MRVHAISMRTYGLCVRMHTHVCVRPGKTWVLSKKRFKYFKAPLFLVKWYGVATYFLYKKKIRKK